MCIYCFIRHGTTALVGMGIGICIFKLLDKKFKGSNTTESKLSEKPESPEKPEIPEIPKKIDNKKYVKIGGKLKDLANVESFICSTMCSMCDKQYRDYSIAVYARHSSESMRYRIMHNTGQTVIIIFVCESCRDELFAMSDSFKRSGINKQIIATLYDSEGNDTGIVANYNELKPSVSNLCPYSDVRICKYSPVCKHCNFYQTLYSVVIVDDKCETESYIQSFACVDCHQKLLNAPGNMFPLDPNGFRLYNDINVFTYVHTLPIGSKIRENIEISTIPAKRQRMYPDIHG